MIKIIYVADPEGGKLTMRAEGHAGYAPAGQDIVCAAVSCLIHLFKDDDRYSAPVFVGVNGDSYLIQRGMDVKVPKAVAEVLEHSIKQDAEAARKSQAMQAAAGTQMMTI